MKDRIRHTRIGLLHSLTGAMAVSERPLLDAELLAIEEINNGGGVLGQLIEPMIRDGTSHPGIFADAAREMLASGVSILFGCWTSASRKAVKSVLETSGGLLWYPVQYEGLEESPHIVYTGSCPNQQIIPATEWLLNNTSGRVFLIGSDYVFPRAANVLVRSLVEERGGSIAGERYFALDNRDFTGVVHEIRQSQSSAVFNTLNGESNQCFYRQCYEAGVRADKLPIMAVSAGETEMRSVADVAAGHLACWSYFQSFSNPENQQFVARFKQRYGSSSVCSDPAVAAYTQVYLWKQTVETAGTFDTEGLRACLIGSSVTGPAGRATIEANHHVAKYASVGRVESSGQFEAIWRSPEQIRPLPWLGVENLEIAGQSLVIECMRSFSDSLHYSTLLEQQLKERRILEDALQASNEELDARVKHRTEELSDAVQRLEQEVVERKEAEAALRESRARYEVIFNCVNDVILVHDPFSGAILDANERAFDLFGWSREELLQHTVGDISSGVPPYTLSNALNLIRNASSGEPQVTEWQSKHKSGRTIWIEVSLRRADIAGEARVVAVVRDVTERHETAELLKRSEERYKAVVDCIPAGIVLHYDFIVRYANPAAVQAAKLASAEEMIGRPIWDFIHPSLHEFYKERYLGLLRGEQEPVAAEGRLINSEGETVYIEGMAIKVSFDGEEGILSTFSDITERRMAEEALRESESRFKGYFENQIVGMAITSPDKGWINVNDKLCEMLGYSREELSSLNWDVVTHPDDLRADIVLFKQVLAGEINGYTLDKRFVRKDGGVIYTILSVGCVRADDGAVRYILAVLVDVTDRVKAEAALRRSEERLCLAMDATTEGVYDWNIPTGEVYYSPGWYRSLGYRASDIKFDISTWLSLTHPDDLVPLRKNLDDHLEGKTPEYRQEYRLRRKDGTFRWTVDHGRVVERDAQGKPVRMVGTDTDITERKQAEDERRALEEHKRVFYRQTILSVTDGKLRICDIGDIQPYMSDAQVVLELELREDMSRARTEVRDICAEAGLDSDETADFVLAFGEAATNAIKHAGKGTVYAGRTDQEIWVAVVDHGPGIDSLVLPAAILKRGFSTKPSMGLGYSIMLDVADQIMLVPSSEGTSVVLVKHTTKREPPLFVLPDTWAGVVEHG